MTVFFCDLFNLLQNLFVIKLGVVPALEIKCPALHLRIVSSLEEKINLIEHSEMLSLE